MVGRGSHQRLATFETGKPVESTVRWRSGTVTLAIVPEDIAERVVEMTAEERPFR